MSKPKILVLRVPKAAKRIRIGRLVLPRRVGERPDAQTRAELAREPESPRAPTTKTADEHTKRGG